MMNIVQVQEHLKDFSQDQLVNEMQRPSGNVPQYLVLSELQRRKRMEGEMLANQAQQDQGTVAQDVVSAAGVPQGGIADVARSMAPQTDMTNNTGIGGMPQAQAAQKMASGGVIKAAGGALFDPASGLRYDEMTEQQLLIKANFGDDDAAAELERRKSKTPASASAAQPQAASTGDRYMTVGENLGEFADTLGISNVASNIGAYLARNEGPVSPGAISARENLANIPIDVRDAASAIGTGLRSMLPSSGGYVPNEMENMLYQGEYAPLAELTSPPDTPIGMDVDPLAYSRGTAPLGAALDSPMPERMAPDLMGMDVGSMPTADVNNRGIFAQDDVLIPMNDMSGRMTYEEFRASNGRPDNPMTRQMYDSYIASASTTPIDPTIGMNVDPLAYSRGTASLGAALDAPMPGRMAPDLMGMDVGSMPTADGSAPMYGFGPEGEFALDQELPAMQGPQDKRGLPGFRAQDDILTPMNDMSGVPSTEQDYVRSAEEQELQDIIDRMPMSGLEYLQQQKSELQALIDNPNTPDRLREEMQRDMATIDFRIGNRESVNDVVDFAGRLIRKGDAAIGDANATFYATIGDYEKAADWRDKADDWRAAGSGLTDEVRESVPESSATTAEGSLGDLIAKGDTEGAAALVEEARQNLPESTGEQNIVPGSKPAPLRPDNLNQTGGEQPTGGGIAGIGGGVSTPTDLEKSLEQDKWMALAKFGFALMASDSPTLGGAFGEAGQAALADYQAAKDAFEKSRMDRELLDLEKAKLRASIAAASTKSAPSLPTGVLTMYDDDIAAATDRLRMAPTADAEVKAQTELDDLLTLKASLQMRFLMLEDPAYAEYLLKQREAPSGDGRIDVANETAFSLFSPSTW